MLPVVSACQLVHSAVDWATASIHWHSLSPLRAWSIRGRYSNIAQWSPRSRESALGVEARVFVSASSHLRRAAISVIDAPLLV